MSNEQAARAVVYWTAQQIKYGSNPRTRLRYSLQVHETLALLALEVP